MPSKYVHDITAIAQHDEICDGSKCPFFYFEYKDETITDSARNRTVLMVGGMHGN